LLEGGIVFGLVYFKNCRIFIAGPEIGACNHQTIEPVNHGWGSPAQKEKPG
jgi:hypothetical protein